MVINQKYNLGFAGIPGYRESPLPHVGKRYTPMGIMLLVFINKYIHINIYYKEVWSQLIPYISIRLPCSGFPEISGNSDTDPDSIS
jgi:hypothetical protein